MMFCKKHELESNYGSIEIRDGKIGHIDLILQGHFGNCVSIDMPIMIDGCRCCNPFNLLSLTGNVGIIIRTIFEVLDIHEDDGKRLSEIKDEPCRVVLDEGGYCVAIGNPEKDKFFVLDLGRK